MNMSRWKGNTGAQKWNDMSNYDMILDSSRIGIDGCAEAIASLLAEV